MLKRIKHLLIQKHDLVIQLKKTHEINQDDLVFHHHDRNSNTFTLCKGYFDNLPIQLNCTSLSLAQSSICGEDDIHPPSRTIKPVYKIESGVSEYEKILLRRIVETKLQFPLENRLRRQYRSNLLLIKLMTYWRS